MGAAQQIIAGIGGASQTYADFTSGGSFTVPAGVTAISMLTIGGGGGGNDIQGGGGSGGGGGALSFSNSVAVTAGETLTIEVGNPGARGTWPGSGVPGTGGTGGASNVKRSSTILVGAVGGGGAYGTGGAGGAAASGTGTTKYSGGNGGNVAGTEIRGGQGGGCGTLTGASDGTAGVTATTDYRGGGDGNGTLLYTPPITQLAVTGGTVNASDLNGTSPNSAYKGAGGGGGAYNADFTQAGQGSAGSGGLVLLIWGGRTFTAGDNTF